MPCSRSAVSPESARTSTTLGKRTATRHRRAASPGPGWQVRAHVSQETSCQSGRCTNTPGIEHASRTIVRPWGDCGPGDNYSAASGIPLERPGRKTRVVGVVRTFRRLPISPWDFAEIIAFFSDDAERSVARLQSEPWSWSYITFSSPLPLSRWKGTVEFYREFPRGTESQITLIVIEG